MTVTIGVDVGGTKIAAGVVDEKGVILDRRRVDTLDKPGAIVEAITTVARDLASGHDISAVGIGAAAFINAARSAVLFAPNLSWRDTPIRGPVAETLGCPVVVENDANAAAWGEFQFGAASDLDDMVFIIVGTGVGGGIVARGELYRGGHGIGGEIGHIRLVRDGELCGCGLHGCLEAYASGTALVREARAQAAANVNGSEALLERAGGNPEAIDGPMVTAAAREGDALSLRLLTDVGRWLGEGMGSLTSVLDPEAFVLGGGVSEAADLIVEPARAALSLNVTGNGNRPSPEVRLASLGNDAGIIGAADLARR